MSSAFQLFAGIKWTHIAAGGLALLLFWVPVMLQKGSKWHVRVGWAFAILMSVVIVTAFAMGIMMATLPLQIRGITKTLAPDELAAFLKAMRISAAFLLYLAGVTLAALWQGIFAIRTRRNPRESRTPFAVGLNALVALSGVAMIGLGFMEHDAPLVALGPVGLLIGGGNLQYMLRGPKSKMHWWYEHIGGMIGTGIAGYTAFFVNGGMRLFPSLLRHQLYTIFWVLPSIIGIPAIIFTVAHYKRKFHEDGKSAPRGPRATSQPAPQA
jgi:hypothetical protein